MATHKDPEPSPESAINQLGSPVAFVHPRHKDRGTYVQRWKVLRERNRNLPVLDFSSKYLAVNAKYAKVTTGDVTPIESIVVDIICHFQLIMIHFQIRIFQ